MSVTANEYWWRHFILYMSSKLAIWTDILTTLFLLNLFVVAIWSDTLASEQEFTKFKRQWLVESTHAPKSLLHPCQSQQGQSIITNKNYWIE